MGVDWDSASHYACVMDRDGSILGEKGFCEMAEWILKVSASLPQDEPVSIDVTRGSVVETLMQRGSEVHPVNPRKLDRLRGRFSPQGSNKDDRRDTRVFALAAHLRTPLPLT